MANSQNEPTRFYNDGPCHPITPLLAKAEKEYRKWFAKTADGVPKWTSPQMGLFERFMQDRRLAKKRAIVGNDHGACLFGPGHEILASKTRGQAQAAWIAIEGWQHFAANGFDNGTIRSVVMPGWNVGVQRWAKALIRPDQILLPPRPHETIDPETQAALDAIRDSLDLTYDTLPREADIRPRSLRRLLDRFPLLKRPVIHGLLRAGETMNVIAPPKVGKSWLASDMALAVPGSFGSRPSVAMC